MEKRSTWVEMDNGVIRSEIPFVAYVRQSGLEARLDFSVSNPPIHHGDPNLFTRLSFERVNELFAEFGLPVHHIIRGECSESGVRDCYVFAPGQRVPFAVIRPLVFERGTR